MMLNVSCNLQKWIVNICGLQRIENVWHQTSVMKAINESHMKVSFLKYYYSYISILHEVPLLYVAASATDISVEATTS